MGNICMNALADPGPPTSDDMDGSKHSKGDREHNKYLPASPLTPQMPVEGMDLEAAINHLNKLDRQRRMKVGREIYLNKQSHARRDGDACPDPFFSAVADDAAFWRLPTVEAFIALLDNYTRSVGRADKVNAEARHEQTTFLAALAATPHLEFALKYIKAHARDPRAKRVTTMPELMKLLKDIWSSRRCGNRSASKGTGTTSRRGRGAPEIWFPHRFTPYRRWRPNDSSGFEHVFVGEESRGKIIGLHNWIQVYLEEKKGNIDYLGWTGRQDKHDDGVTLATIKFAWADDKPGEVTIKPVSTILVGATPEFEIAALSLAFLCGEQEGDNRMELGRERIKIVCYPHDGKGGPKVASAYIELA